MKFLVFSEFGEIADLAIHLQDVEKHQVAFYVEDKGYRAIADGILTHITDWYRYIGKSYVWVFDSCSFGDLQDWLREKGEAVFGGCAEGDKLENDRQAGQDWFAEAGFDMVESRNFKDFDEAHEFVEANADKRWILKQSSNAPKSLNHMGKFDDGSDMLYHLDELKKRWNVAQFGPVDFDLMEVVEGLEVAASAFFNGSDWMRDQDGKVVGYLNFEEKKEADGGTGETCYDDQTEILTKDGFKLFADLGDGDQIAQVDPDTREISLVYPRARQAFPYSGKMLHFKNRLADVLVTPDHRMYVAQRRRPIYRIRKAKSVFAESNMLQAGKWKGEDISSVEIPEMTVSNGHGGKRLPSFRIAGDAFCRFMGIYLAEGSTTKEGRIFISQFGAKNQAKIAHLLEGFPLKSRLSKAGYILQSVQMCAYVSRFGKYAYCKRVPDIIKNASVRQIRFFLDAFRLGDGDIHGGQSRYTSTSRRMIDDIQEMLVRLGVASTVTPRKAETKKDWPAKWIANCRPAWSVEERKNDFVCLRKPPKEIDYTGMVYCVSVPTGLVVVRRNGRVLICGNCGEMGTTFLGCTEENELFRELICRQAIKTRLRKIGFRGVFDINCIVTDEGKIVALEPTCRFGVPATSYEFCEGLDNAGSLIEAVAKGQQRPMSLHLGWGMVMVVVAKPFPLEADVDDEATSIGERLWILKDGKPVDEFDSDQEKHVHLYNFKLDDEGLKVATKSGYLLTVTATGEDIAEIREGLIEYIKENMDIAGIKYRSDIGARVEQYERETEKEQRMLA